MIGRLASAGLSINREKCKFGLSTVSFLGHSVSKDGISLLPSKVLAIADMPRPTMKVELQHFFGSTNFYHRFVPYLAKILAPLHSLTASCKTAKSPLAWESVHQDAFIAAKDALANAMMLSHPSSDPGMLVMLTMDASDVAVSTVLAQGAAHQPLGFYSKKLLSAEKKCSACDKELLALYLSIRHFRHNLEGQPTLHGLDRP